jgi:hypothetical protein
LRLYACRAPLPLAYDGIINRSIWGAVMWRLEPMCRQAGALVLLNDERPPGRGSGAADSSERTGEASSGQDGVWGKGADVGNGRSGQPESFFGQDGPGSEPMRVSSRRRS